MRNVTIAAAAIAMATLITATTASADYLGGAPRKNQATGLCWKGSKGSEGFGFWRACPQPATARNGRGRPGQPGQPGIDGETRSGGSAYSGG
jgi:hypothetical protein